MAGYQDLNEFERDVIIGARKMGHSISETSLWPAKDHATTGPKRRLTRIIKHDRRANLPQIAAGFNAGPSTNVTVRSVQRNIIDMGSPGPVNIDIRLLMTENTLPGLTSLISN
ncbi:uncharacterized protein TNCV_3010011 [Trichonephila clavipes]|nr:uncharacterized protein TNCV_3010011 [Trichonephila clavipes]